MTQFDPCRSRFLLSSALLTAGVAAGCNGAADVPPTPGPQDVPRPVPVQISLAGSERPDIVRFLQVRTALEPSLSPDGRKVAFRTEISGEPQLWVVSSEGGWPRQLTFGRPVTFHRWSPGGEWIVYGQDRDGDEREGFYVITPDGTLERELLAPSEAFREFGDFTSDGYRIVYATTERTGVDFDIHLLDVETGEDRRVFEGRIGLYAASFSPDGSSVLLTEARGEDANDVYLLDLERGELEPLFQADDRAFYGSFSWRPDGSAFHLTTNQDREYAGLALYDLGSRSLTYLETPDRDVESVALSPDGHFLAWTTNEEGASTLHVRDLDTGRPVSPPDLPPGVYEIRWAAAEAVASVTVRSARVPGDIWTWNPRTGALHRATRSDGGGLDLSRMVLPDHHSFEARDGVLIHGLLYTPPGIGQGKRPPLLLAVHGGPTTQARPTFNPAHQYLLTRGIAVFDLNYRGSTGYGKSFARLNDGRLRENELHDLEDAVLWLEGLEVVDSSRVAVMGGSYGGYLTKAALTRVPHLFRAGVSFVGVANWITALEGASPQLQASDRIEYGDIHDPEDREFFRQISPLTHVEDVRAPAMVLHGANDPRVPVEESDQFVRAVRALEIEVEYLRFPDEGHGIRRLENRIIAYRRVADFLERTLDIRTAK